MPKTSSSDGLTYPGDASSNTTTLEEADILYTLLLRGDAFGFGHPAHSFPFILDCITPLHAMLDPSNATSLNANPDLRSYLLNSAFTSVADQVKHGNQTPFLYENPLAQFEYWQKPDNVAKKGTTQELEESRATAAAAAAYKKAGIRMPLFELGQIEAAHIAHRKAMSKKYERLFQSLCGTIIGNPVPHIPRFHASANFMRFL